MVRDTEHRRQKAGALQISTNARQRLEHVQGRIQAFDLRPFEGGSTNHEGLEDLQSQILDIVDEGMHALEFVRSELHPEMDLEASLSVGLSECDSYRRRLKLGSPEQPRWTVIAACAALLGRLSRLLDFTVGEVTEENEAESTASLTVDRLQASLEARALYGQLINELSAVERPEPTELALRLRSIGTRIAMMVGQPAFRHLWVQDRIVIEALQQRIIEWLKDPVHARGLGIWADLEGLVAIFRQISLRQELIQHDVTILEQMLRLLEGMREDDVFDLSRRLEVLLGMDSELDELVRKRVMMTVGDGILLLKNLLVSIRERAPLKRPRSGFGEPGR